jgi:ABC-type protease/lipase transport system fused ATPase/permease subunit
MEYVTRGLKERAKQKEERDLLNKTINEATEKIVNLNNSKSQLELEQIKIEAEVGPLKYVAELIYGEDAKSHFDSAVRIVILILIFVFDPLAVLLLIAANISLRQWKMKRALTQTNKKEDLEKKIDTLNKKVKKLRGYQGLVKEFGDNPDEIRLKLNQIYDFNDKK